MLVGFILGDHDVEVDDRIHLGCEDGTTLGTFQHMPNLPKIEEKNEPLVSVSSCTDPLQCTVAGQGI
jgi:hypothetical protein